MSVSPATERALRSAMERLASGSAQHCDGELTVSNLAREAGVSRATANRATGIIAELHQRHTGPATGNDQGALRVETLRERIGYLEVELATAKQAAHVEDGELRRRTAVLAQQVQALTLDNHRLREQAADHAKVRNLRATTQHPRY